MELRKWSQKHVKSYISFIYDGSQLLLGDNGRDTVLPTSKLVNIDGIVEDPNDNNMDGYDSDDTVISLTFQKNGHPCNTQQMQPLQQIPTIVIHPPTPKDKHTSDKPRRDRTIPNSSAQIEHQSKCTLKRQHAMIWPDEYERADTSKRQKTGLIRGNTVIRDSKEIWFMELRNKMKVHS